MSDKELYQVIAEELKTNNLDPALWLQAKASAFGDKDKTEAAYIRLRFADLKKNKPLYTVAPLNPSPDAPRSDLAKLRGELAKRLLANGKSSLYSTLDLHPEASDTLIAAAIADIEGKNLVGFKTSEAEFKYAKDTLTNPELREQYDRQLLNSLTSAPKPYVTSNYDDVENDSWWDSRKVSVIIGVCSFVLIGYLGLAYWKESHSDHVQQQVMDVVKETANLQQSEVETDLDAKQRLLALEEQRRRQELEIRARTADQAFDQQRALQEARDDAEFRRQEAERKRNQAMQDQAENQRISREKQYYACLNQQLNFQLSQRNGSSYDAEARCAMYKR